MKGGSCSVSIAEQLTHLLLLEDGWYNGDGKAYDPSGNALVKARVALEAIVESGVPVPYLYPTLENEVRAEWDTESGGVVMTIDATASEATLVIMNDETDGTERMRLPLGDERLTRRLVELFKP